METEMDVECPDGGAAAIRELAAAVRATVPEPPEDPDALLTAEQVGELLQLSPRTLKDRAAAGAVPHHRFGKHYRFTRCERGACEAASAAVVRSGRCSGLPRRVRRAEYRKKE
ncbi:helix-turn-helix domain-containing protein [Amycolatopsis sp. NPDC101161]|uniref:helix-turn-helix domain-containing protein n=1 Tax=Amycolatopsis sp. NPDC101161 TaxID=3363940 RepID=UPI0037F9F6F9